ncbi:MAG: tRNA (guanosine(37)-N1)-methyltransferase TrmD [Candidatus Kerfeldbacteria bacterium]|nr:tRNA (guanosine(37)-N1)-methyltransferase TrmD [Candidatus Kerfeldbacteria bacterium]
MYRFDLLTIFPDIFDSYLGASILKRAQSKKLIEVHVHDIRKFATDKHHTTDDRPYGGGPGMVMKVEPIFRCLKSIRRKRKSRIILLSAKGKTFDQAAAKNYAKKYDQLILIAGHYEGVDERIMKYVDEEVSIGNYILTGGELPSLNIVDAVSRLLPGVLGDDTSSHDESFSSPNYREYPHYTRPEVFRGARVPRELRSGNHRVIEEWRKRHQTSKRSS